MQTLDFLALCLATGALVNAWRNGSIFATARARIETLVEMHGQSNRPRYLLVRLLDCAFCLSYWAPLLPGIALAAAVAWPAWGPWFRLPVYSLAATRLSWLLNVYLREEFRY